MCKSDFLKKNIYYKILKYKFIRDRRSIGFVFFFLPSINLLYPRALQWSDIAIKNKGSV